jgi:hypothetical protein
MEHELARRARLDRVLVQVHLHARRDDGRRLDLLKLAPVDRCRAFGDVVVGVGHADIDDVDGVGAGVAPELDGVPEIQRRVGVYADPDLFARNLEAIICRRRAGEHDQQEKAREDRGQQAP